MSFPLWLECALGRQGRYRAVRIAFFILALPWWASPSRAGGSKSESNIVEVDTEHMFGFTEGADIGAAGERQAAAGDPAKCARSSAPAIDGVELQQFHEHEPSLQRPSRLRSALPG